MKDAFKILGATPLDNRETLNELFEDKQLICDNEDELASAYSELTTPKKRVKHEILYYSNGIFSEFDTFFNNSSKGAGITFGVACDAIIAAGKWFDGDKADLLSKINNARDISNFPSITDSSVVFSSILELKDDCINSIGAFLDARSEKNSVSLFNLLVQKPDFQSYLVDELLARYELRVSNSIQEKEKKCDELFASIEQNARAFFASKCLHIMDKQVSDFKTALNEWDRLVQPLQVNAQQYGANHEKSAQYVHSLRNKIINLCNKSQDVLISYINEHPSVFQYKNDIIGNFICFCDIMIELIKILQNTFAEIETTAEQLKKDLDEISKLRTTLISFDKFGSYKKVVHQNNTQRSSPYKPASNTSSSNSNKHTEKHASTSKIKTIGGVVGIISLFLMIVGFSVGLNAMGVAFLSIMLGCVAFLLFEKKILKNKKIGEIIVVFTIILFSCTVIPVGIIDSGNSNTSSNSNYSNSNNSSYNSNSSNSKYTITLNKDGGSGGSSTVSAIYGNPMPSATAPSKKGYKFGGYYTSKNGEGTQYYTASMSSAKNWNKYSTATLYAYWIEEDGSITLTKSNFETYFTLTSSCSVNQYGTTATYDFSISPKSSFKYSNSKNPSSIKVTIGLDISSSSIYYGTPSEYKITVTLYKSSGYSYSGSRNYSIGSSEKYWSDGIYEVDAKIYN